MSAGAKPNPEIREALDELQRYLSDALPPLIVADSVKLLLDYSPELVASDIQAWVTSQYRGSNVIPVSDYLFHALKKMHMMGEFRLVPREPFQSYMEGLKETILNYCPPEDREQLKVNLAHLGDAPAALSSPVEVIFRQSSAGRPGAAARHAGSPEMAARGIERLTLLLERLGREAAAGTDDANGGRRGELADEAMAAAARASRGRGELEASLERLRALGIEAGTEDVFRALGQSLPGWALPEGAAPSPPENSNLKAMRRIVAEAEDPAEGATRFHQMVKAAIERFNDGSLAQAVPMIELAERIIAEREVDPGTAELIRRKGDESLDGERLRKYVESPEHHSQLRRILNFFIALTPEGLLAGLRREMKREGRRLLLALLEIHGEPARSLAFEKLKSLGEPRNEQDWYLVRNLLYLMRRIPRPAGADLIEELQAVVRHCELGFPAPILKEAVAALGQIKHEKAEQALLLLLGDIEAVLGKPAEAPYDLKELKLVLDRVLAALARFGTASARRAAVDHCLKRKTEFGDTMARLAELSGENFSDDPETVERLLEALKANLPFKIFGLVLNQKDQNLQYTIEALSATPHPAVRKAFREVLDRFPDHPLSRTVSKALAGFDQTAQPAESPAPSLTGDLELFGLPALLQSLAESRVSGSLALKDPKGEVFGILLLKEGKLLSCRVGPLQGEEGFYQLMERPAPGTFLFTRQADRGSGAKESGAGESAAELAEILPLSLEGMRRYDEFQQARAVVPDDVLLKPTSVKPTPHPDERDGILVNGLWTAVFKGATPLQCESTVAADCYRIRRLLAHWVDNGALAAAG